MSSKTLEQFLQERLSAYDPTIDLSSGSPADSQVVQPTVARYQPDPFEMPVEEFLDARMAAEYPDTNVQEGTGLRDLMIKPMQVLLDPVIREIQLLRKGQSLQAPDQLADAEVDALVANLFVSRNTGDLARGKARLYFNAPQAVRVSVGNIFYTAANLRFFPDRQQSISAENMAFNQSGNLFYFDVDVVAEQAGEEYNIEAGTLVGVSNISVAVRVTNLSKFEDGLPTETSTDLIERAATSVTERSLVTPRGTSARLRAEFPALTQLQVIGYGDAEMQRDLLTGGDLGEVLLSGNDGYSVDDGAGNTTTTQFGVRSGNLVPAGFHVDEDLPSPLYLLTTEVQANNGAYIVVAHRDHLLIPADTDIFDSSDVGRTIIIMGTLNGVQVLKIANVNGGDLTLTTPEGAAYTGAVETGISWVLVRGVRKSKISLFASTTELTLSTEEGSDSIHAGVKMFGWEIRRQELSISETPSGVVLSAEREALVTQSNQVHLGGCSDFYVRGQSADHATQVVQDVEDGNPLFRGANGVTKLAEPSFFWDRPTPDRDEASYGTGLPTTVNFVAMGVEPGDCLVVESGPDAGAKTILRVGRSNSSIRGDTDRGCLQVSPPFTSSQTFLRYRIVKTVSLNLRAPTLLKASGAEGKTQQSSNIFTTVDMIDFSALGIAAGDILRLVDGVDAGEYVISKVSGTGYRNLELSASLTTSATGIMWEITRVQTGIKFPLIQVQSIDLLDSGSQPTGYKIPYGVPVDVRSSTFSNFGNGIKCKTTKAVVGIIGRTPIDATDVTYPLPPYANIAIAVNGFFKYVDLSGATSKENVVAKINAVIPNIAKAVPIEGKYYLQLRSDTNWLFVEWATPSAGNQYLGIDAGDDNRQIRCLDANFSWMDPTTWTETAEEVRGFLAEELDSVQIQGSSTPVNVYLKSVTAQRLLVLAFDETQKTVRFPVPQYNIAVQIGTRSIGNARIYFKDPTSMEVLGRYRAALQNTQDHPANLAAVRNAVFDTDVILETEVPNTYFSATVGGVKLRFIPDPALSRVVVPDPASSIPNNLCSVTDTYGTGVALSSDPALGSVPTSRSEQIDFLARRIRPGDQLDITYAPILGTAAYTISSLPGKDMDIRIGGSPSKKLTFTDQTVDATSMLVQLNNFFGSEVAFVDGDTGYLRIEADFSIEILSRAIDDPRIADWAVPFLGMLASNRTNAAQNAGSYTIKGVGKTRGLDSTESLLVADDEAYQLVEGWTSQHFIVKRLGSQRVHTTAMKSQMENGLYYMDVQLLSDGAGDLYNIPEDTVFVVTGYDADGFHLEVANPNLSFSTEEEVSAVFSRQILLEGETDNLGNAITITGQNIQVNYDYSSLTEAIQLFASSELDRVVTASLLARHLLPNYLYFELVYQGGSSAEVVQEDVEAYLASLGPDDSVQASSLQALATRRGASFVQNPLVLVSLGVDANRVLSVVRSTNLVSHGRLSTFFPGRVVVTQG